MEEIASVGIAIQTGDIERGIKSLDTLANQGPKVEKSMQGIETAVAKTGKSLATLGQGGADAGFEKVAQGSKSAAEGVSRLGVEAKDSAESMLSLTRTGIAAFLGGQIVQGANSAAKAIYEASAAGERLRTMLDFSTGGNGAREIEYLREVTAKLGLEFASTSRAYGQFQAAAKGTALEGQKARDIFESVAKASAVMGLSTEQSSGALLALQQMISKGTVQAEELRGQLGERLPGAFQIAAKAMGVTTAELGKMLEQGQVVADVFLPKFAAALEQNLGGAADKAADRLDAAVNRFDNAWERLKQSVGDSGVSAALRGELNAITNDLTVFRETMDKVRASGGGTASQFIAAGSIEAARAGFAILNGSANLLNGTINTLSGGFIKLDTNLVILPDSLKTSAQQASAMAKDLAGAEMQLAALQARGDATSENIYIRSSYAQLAQYVAKLKEAKQEQDKLAGLGQSDPRDQSKFEPRSQSYAAEAKRLEDIQAAMQKVLGGISGVKDSFQKDLAALFAGYNAGLIKLEDYRQAVQKLINESGGGKASAALFKEQNKELEGQKKLIAELSGVTASYQEDLSDLQKMRKAGNISEERYVELVTALIAKQPEARRQINDQAEELKKLAKAQEDAAKAHARYIAELEKGGDEIAKQVQKLREEEEALAVSAAKHISLAQALEQVAIARLQEQQAAMMGAGNQAGIDAIQREIDKRRELIGLIGNKEARDASKKALEETEREAERMANSIEQSITDSLMRGFESGKGFAENLRDTVENMFKTMVLKPVISAVMAPLSVGITSMLGVGAASAATGAAGSAAGAGLLGAIGLGGLSASSIGSAIGAGFMSTIGGSTIAGGQAAGLLAGGAATGTGFAGMVGAALPWVGGAALLGNALGLFRSTEYKGTSLRGTLGSGDINNYDVTRRSGSLFSGPTWRETMSGESAVSDSVQAAYEQMRMATAGMAEQLGINGDAIRKYTQSLYIDGNGKSPEDMQRLLAEAVTSANDALAQFALGTSAYTKEGESASQTLARLSVGLQGVNYVLDELGQSTLSVSLGGGAMADQLAGLFGGLDSFVQTASNYYQAYYSEAERAAKTTEQVTKGLAQYGLSMPATREAYRALVEAQDLTTDSGRKSYAELLKLAPAFAQVTAETVALTGAADATAKAMAEAAARAAEAGRQALAGLAQDRGSLEVELLRAQGSTAAAAALELQQTLARLTEGLNATDKAAVVAAQAYNDTLRAQIETALAATEAQRVAAEKEAAVAAQRFGIEGQLLQLQGDTAALRARELAALDPSNRALQERIFALQDEQAAAQEAAQTQAQAAAEAERVRQAGEQQAKAIADQRYGLEGQLLQLQGDTAALRARELAALDPANRALQERINAIKDEQAAAQAAAQAGAAEAQRLQAVASQRYGLEGQLLQLQGDTVAIRARERAALDEGNRAIFDRIMALQDVKAAEQIAAQQAERVASERYGLDGRLLQLQGDTAAIRARELAALDESNRALMLRIYALQDEQAAKVLTDQAIARASEEAAAKVRALADVLANLGGTRFDLENQLLGLQGNTAEVARRTRERDLAELTKGLSAEDAVRVTAAYDLNTALKQQITDTQAAQQAAKDLAQAQAQAAADAQRAAEQFKSAWQSVADSIFDEVARIRGLISGGSASSFAASQSAFAIAAAQAKAGDQEAAKLLPGLSQAMLTLAEAQATSLLELQRIRAQAAATLSGVGGSIASQYGLNVPKLATGTNYVPSDMLAVIHEGEAVVPRAYNPAAGGASQSNAELLAEVKALRIKTEAQSDQLLRLNERTTQIMDRWELNGLPKERTV